MKSCEIQSEDNLVLVKLHAFSLRHNYFKVFYNREALFPFARSTERVKGHKNCCAFFCRELYSLGNHDPCKQSLLPRLTNLGRSKKIPLEGYANI